MIPHWFTVLSWVGLAIGIASAAWLAWRVSSGPPKMKVMAFVWPLCGLFGGILTVWFFERWAAVDDAPFPVSVAKGTLHCGAGCSLADLIAETAAFLLPGILVAFGLGWLISEQIFAAWVFDYILALAIGIVFQFFAIAPMRDLGFTEGMKQAAKADVLSLTCWQIGMYGLMALAHFWLFPHIFGMRIEAGRPEFWFAMQAAMLAGFCTAYPINWWLISSGIKEEM